MKSIKVRHQVHETVRRAGTKWNERDGLQRRAYASYEAYLEHQRRKLNFLDLAQYDKAHRAALKSRLGAFQLKGRAVLCLAARNGGEVCAFKDHGAFAVGVDLNPGPDNPHVLVGDFHSIQFPDGSADAVFTNSLDHAFDLPRLLREIGRVLSPEGVFIAEIVAADVGQGDFEALWWDSEERLISAIEEQGFEAAKPVPFSSPWKGVQVAFKKTAP